jgi:hypothetical protein
MKSMKKLIYLLSVTFILLQSCSSGDSSESSNDNSLLLKKWYWVSQTYQGTTYNLKPCSNGNIDYFEFISPNVANFYHVSGNNNCSFVLEPYTWTKNGNILTLKMFGIAEIATISELTATRLVYTLVEANGNSSVWVFSSY